MEDPMHVNAKFVKATVLLELEPSCIEKVKHEFPEFDRKLSFY